jgi:hypothetical protein
VSSVSREIVFYRVAWAVVGAALVAACTFGAVTVGSTLSAQPSVAASVPKATANMVKPLAPKSTTTSLDSQLKLICHTGKALTHTVESGTGKTITIHC